MENIKGPQNRTHPEKPKGNLSERQAFEYIFGHSTLLGAEICKTSQQNFYVWRCRYNKGKLGGMKKQELLKLFGLEATYKFSK